MLLSGARTEVRGAFSAWMAGARSRLERVEIGTDVRGDARRDHRECARGGEVTPPPKRERRAPAGARHLLNRQACG